MKRSYLMIAAAAALFAACAENEKLNNELITNSKNDKIGFSVYSEKTTRTADQNSTNLYDYYNEFDVYSWKTVGSTASPVFAHEPVAYFDADAADGVVYAGTEKPSDEWGTFGTGTGEWQTGWFYKDVRYWDKLASGYTFFAIAPYEATPAPALDVQNSYDNIKIGSSSDTYDINGEEKNAMTNEKKYYNFTKDYMLANKMTTRFQKVELNFHHILTKLNVKITLQDNYKGGNQDLTITDLEIVGLENKGYFVYTTNMTTNGWTTTANETQTLAFGTDYKIYSKDNQVTTYSGYYWFQTLVFPQTLTCMAQGAQTAAPAGKYLYIEYTIGTEVFKAYYDLANVFNSNLEPAQGEVAAGTYEFAQGSEYTLNIKVGPMPIEFEATATAWDEKTAVDHTVE